MTATAAGLAPDGQRSGVAPPARPAGFLRDLGSVAGRGLRALPREPEAIIPSLFFPLFFFVVNIGALQDISAFAGVDDYKAFQVPVAIVFAVTGVSRAAAVVTDIQSGYFDRLLVSPINRWSLLLGLMVADLTLAVALAVPVVALGLLVGVRFATGLLGIAAFLLLAGLWALTFSGFPYAVALRTANAGAVNASFVLFIPFVFLTTAFVPQEAMTGWLATAAGYNPVTYLLRALRGLISDGWVAADLLAGIAAVIGLGVVSLPLAFAALRTRVSGK